MYFFRTEPPTMLLAIAAPLAGMTAEVLLRPKKQPAEEEEHERPRQLVGQTCAVCEKRISVSRDAMECDECGAAIHDGCESEHTCAA